MHKYTTNELVSQKPDPKVFLKLKRNPIVFILHNIRSLENVGLFFRLADAIRAEKIYLTGYTGYPRLENDAREERIILHAEKEKLFSEKKSYSDKIRAAIAQSKAAFAQRNEHTQHVKELKKSRELYHSVVQEKAKSISRDEPTHPVTSTGTRVSPARLLQEMEALERKIEQDALSFDKETKIMKLIKEKKKQYKALKAAQDKLDQQRQVVAGLQEARHQADEAHTNVQSVAAQSQQAHEQFLALNKDIRQLKTASDAVYALFLNKKKEFVALEKLLNEKLTTLSQLDHQASHQRENIAHQHHVQTVQHLQSKREEILTKLKSGKKLSTEDILIMHDVK